MRILILGAGAVGTYIGSKLTLDGNQVIFYQRNAEACRRINEHGILLHETGTTRAGKAMAFTSLASCFTPGTKVDVAIFCVKSFSTAEVLEALLPWFSQVDQVISLQNGLGNEEVLLSKISSDRLTAGSLTTACSLQSPGESTAENRGGVALASISGAPREALVSLFKHAGVETFSCPEWRTMKWSKLLLNILGNIQSALLDWPANKLFSDPTAFRLERQAFLEAVNVMTANGMTPIRLPHQPVPWYVWGIKHLPVPILQVVFQSKMKRGRGNKPPSLHLDLLNGKRETELPFLYGSIIECGKLAGVRTPALSALAETFQAITEGRLSWDAVKGRPQDLWARVLEREGLVRS